MMTKQTATMIWDHLRQMNGIAIRLIEQLKTEDLDKHPVQNMRTPKELVVHMYLTSIQAVTEGIVTGEIIDTETTEEPAVRERIRTAADLVAFAKGCWAKATQAIEKATDAQLSGMVKSPWGGMSFPGAMCLNITRDEMTHHRGQLYAYVRQFGYEVPMMWDFEHNAPEYAPKPQPARA